MAARAAAAAAAAAEEPASAAAAGAPPDRAARKQARRAAKQLRRAQRAQGAGGENREEKQPEQDAGEWQQAHHPVDAGDDGQASKRARREAKQQRRRQREQEAEERQQQRQQHQQQQQEQPTAQRTPAAAAPAAAPAAAATDAAEDGPARKRAKREAEQRRQRGEQGASQGRDQQQAQDSQERRQQTPGGHTAAAHRTAAAAAAAEPPALGVPASVPAPAAPAAPELYKFWCEQDVDRLVRCVEDAAYRRQHVGVDDLDWRAIAGHLGRSQQAVRSKYRHQKVTQDGSGHRAPAAVGVRKSITYGSMAVAGLCALPDQSGTGEEICAAIEAHPPFQPLLDRTMRPDSLGVLRWKQRIREELSHRAYFQNSATKRGGEVVWRLNPDALDDLPRKQHKKLEELKLPGAPFLGKGK